MKSQNLLLRLKRQLLSRPRLIGSLFAILFLILATIIFNFFIWQPLLSRYPLSQLQIQANNFFDPISALAQTNGRTNILLLGRGDTSHETPNLTDSIILASINPKTGHILILPLPRDIWIPSLRAKLNTTYHYGQLRQSEQAGLTLTKSAVSEITDLPIHYAVLVDFYGFSQIIDLLGGIDIYVKQTFDDYKYPIPGKENAEPESARYQHLHFEQGTQTLNGQTALQYVRSRHAVGPEGTDLARSQRQQQVLLAIQDKLLSTNLIFNRSKIFEIKDLIGQSLVTDIPDNLYAAFARLALNYKSENLHQAQIPVYLKTGNGNGNPETALLINPPISPQYDNQWILAPSSGDFNEIHLYIRCLLENQDQSQCLESK